jgi:multidrug efflux system outer membrane protein
MTRSTIGMIAAMAWLLTAAGCASVAPIAAPPQAVEVPAQWAAGVDATAATPGPLAQWWQRFGDAQLSRLVERALQANTSVNSAQAALRQARALRDVTAAGLLPTLDGSASAQRIGTGSGSTKSTVNTFLAGLDASWELDVFGGQRSALQADEASALASAASLGDVQVSVAAEVALDYIALRNAQALLAIARENLASQRETLQITQWRLQAGLVTSLDVEQARTSAEQTAALLPALQKTVDQTSHALSVLVGQAPSALSAELGAASPVPAAPDDLALAFPAETLRQRADVRAAEFEWSAARARVSQAEAARWPSVFARRLAGLGLAHARIAGRRQLAREQRAGQRQRVAVRRRRSARAGRRAASRARAVAAELPLHRARCPEGCRRCAGRPAQRPRAAGAPEGCR